MEITKTSCKDMVQAEQKAVIFSLFIFSLLPISSELWHG